MDQRIRSWCLKWQSRLSIVVILLTLLSGVVTLGWAVVVWVMT